MNWLENARNECLRLFNEAYPDYVTEDERYLDAVSTVVTPEAMVLDAGCGWRAPFAERIAPRVHHVVGVDVGIDEPPRAPGVSVVQADLERLPFEDATFDVVMSRSVFEHLARPAAVLAELSRVMKHGGRLVFLVPNLWDYVSLVSAVVPNRLHGIIVEAIQGRSCRDTFPTYYRANTVRKLRRLLGCAGLSADRFEWLSQYPAYLMFSPRLFRAGIAYERLVREHQSLAWLRSWILGIARKP